VLEFVYNKVNYIRQQELFY